MRNSSTSPTPSPQTLTQKYEDLERGGQNKKLFTFRRERKASVTVLHTKKNIGEQRQETQRDTWHTECSVIRCKAYRTGSPTSCTIQSSNRKWCVDRASGRKTWDRQVCGVNSISPTSYHAGSRTVPGSNTHTETHKTVWGNKVLI